MNHERGTSTAFGSSEKFGSSLEKEKGKQGPMDSSVEHEWTSSLSRFGKRSPGRMGPMRAPPASFVERSDIVRRFCRVTMRSPATDVGVPRERNSMKRVSKEGSSSNVRKRLAVSSEVSTSVCKVKEVTEWKVGGPEKDEISSAIIFFRDGKEPPRKDGGISKLCPA